MTDEDTTHEDATNIAYLTEERYFRDNPQDLYTLLEFVADRRITTILQGLSGEVPLFHNTQYFYSPATKSWDGMWHRDTQFLAKIPDLKKQRLFGPYTGAHFRIAFVANRQLQYVPGSHKRWDTAEEYRIRKGENASAEIPHSRVIELNTGDACLFHAWGIHRGKYRQATNRRTLNIIYGWGGHCDYGPPPPMCFANEEVLDNLGREAQVFYRKFIDTYKSYWQKILYCFRPQFHDSSKRRQRCPRGC